MPEDEHKPKKRRVGRPKKTDPEVPPTVMIRVGKRLQQSLMLICSIRHMTLGDVAAELIQGGIADYLITNHEQVERVHEAHNAYMRTIGGQELPPLEEMKAG